MPDGQLIVFGSDIIKDPSIGTTSGTGNANQGTATVQSGERVFEDDDIVVFDIIDIDANSELQSSSKLSDITVYDSYADFLAGIVKYDYQPQNPGQTADLQSDLSGHGDGYAQFVSANILQPDASPGAPTFNQLFIAPGSDIASSVGDANGTLAFDRNQDFDFNADGDTVDTGEPGNILLRVGDYVTPTICFTRGTMILTPQGERRIEDLQPGDMVWTMDSGPQPLRWIGHRRLPAAGSFAPVRFEANAIHNIRPLEVSQNHRILRSGPAIELLFGTSEVLVPAKYLINGINVTLRETGWVNYVHILFDAHQVIWANGAPAESLLPGHVSAADEAALASEAELLAIFPDLAGDTVPAADAARLCLRKYEAELI